MAYTAHHALRIIHCAPCTGPLFEQEVVLDEGSKRERRKVMRFSDQLEAEHKKDLESRKEVPQGHGVKLGDIEFGMQPI